MDAVYVFSWVFVWVWILLELYTIVSHITQSRAMRKRITKVETDLDSKVDKTPLLGPEAHGLV